MNLFRISKIKSQTFLFHVPLFSAGSSSNIPKNSLIQHLSALDADSKEKALHIKIPKTSFNPRFHATTSETKYHPLISEDLYRWQVDAKKDAEHFILHESPISLHEELHIGHFFNKTIKDIILRNKMMRGFQINSQIGFNSHGQAIENAALRKFTEETERSGLTVEEIREMCKKYVNERFEDYVSRVRRWGIMTDISKAYLTSNPLYEAAVLEVFQFLYEKATMVQQWRPLYWSIITRKAVFEDEIKHEFAARKGYFIKYQVSEYGPDDYLRLNCPRLFLILFSTEPWTLTAAQALSINPQFSYCIFKKDQDFLLMHEQAFVRSKHYFSTKNGYEFIMKTNGKMLNGLKVKDPLSEKERTLGVVLTNKLKATVGSAINPICPAHYSEDFQIAQENKLSRQGFVDEEGNLQGLSMERLNGKNVVLDDANVEILKMLAENERLLEELTETANVSFHLHRETKEQIIIRSTPLWFCEISKEEKMEFLEELKEMKILDFSEENSFYPSFLQIVEEIDEQWCISHKGNWGIPLPLFYYKGTTRAFMKSDILVHIIRNVRLHGSDIWWKWKIEDLVPKKYKSMVKNLEKSKEVFDIWFEVGCSQYAVLEKGVENRPIALTGTSTSELVKKTTEKTKKIEDIDLIVEGKDQSECWLMGLALVNMARTNVCEIKTMKHHTLIKDPSTEYTTSVDKLNKYSTIKYSLDDIIEGSYKFNGERQYGLGVDVIRWLVASRDDLSKSELIPITPQEVEQMNREVNMIRRCFREMLMHLNHEFPKQYYIDLNDLPFLHDFIYTHLILFLHNTTKAYEDYDISKVYRLIMDFVKLYVWDIYLQGTKSSLISNPLDQESYTIVYMYWKICENLLTVLAPILCHNAQNIFEYLKRDKEKSIFHCQWPEISKEQVKKVIDRVPEYQILVNLRNKISEELIKNINRIDKDFQKIEKEFELVFVCSQKSEERKLIESMKKDAKHFFGVQDVKLETSEENKRREDLIIASIKHVESRKGKQNLEFKARIYNVKWAKCYRCLQKQSKKDGELCLNCQEYLQKHQLKLPELVL